MSRAQLTSTVEQNTGGAVAPFVAGKNKIINGDFGIWQRGTTFTNPAAGIYTADRFVVSYDTAPSAGSIAQVAFDYSSSPASDKLPISGYNSSYFLRSTITTVGSTAVAEIQQRIENVRTFAGQTVTLSFWAKADSARSSIVYLYQNSGGTGSAYSATPTLSVTTSWQRYSFTLSLGSISGFTIGAGSSLYAVIRQVVAAGSVLDIWGVQLEAGSVATPFTTATGTLSGELEACQRYYWRNTGTGYTRFTQFSPANSATLLYAQVQNPIQMRIKPTSIDFSNLLWWDNVSIGNAIGAITINGDSSPLNSFLEVSSTGMTQYRNYQLMANGGTGYIGLSAEL